MLFSKEEYEVWMRGKVEELRVVRRCWEKVFGKKVKAVKVTSGGKSGSKKVEFFFVEHVCYLPEDV